MGKGTYSTRVADFFGLQHIASGDLVRDEIKSGSAVGREVRPARWFVLCIASCCCCRLAAPQAPSRMRVPPLPSSIAPPQMAAIVNAGNLLPDALILRVIRDHFMRAHSEGTDRFLLDGFPRTAEQAEVGPRRRRRRGVLPQAGGRGRRAQERPVSQA